MDQEGRKLKATWLWFITHSSEKEINRFIRKYQWSLSIPITYDCHCQDQECSSKTEYFKMDTESDLAVLYHNVISGSCISNDEPNADNRIILNMSFLQDYENLYQAQLNSRNANTVGIYGAHVFAARNLKSCFQTAEGLYQHTFRNVTYKKGLYIFDLLLEHKRYQILDAAVCTSGWMFGFGRVYRDKFHTYTANSIQNSLGLVIKRNDAQACQIMLPAIQSRCFLASNNHANIFNWVVVKVSENNALECLHVLTPYLKKLAVVDKEKDNDFLLKFLQKETLKTLFDNNILALSTCLRVAVEEDYVDIVRWMLDRLHVEEEKGGQLSLLLQATINDSPDMIQVLLQASHSNRSNRSFLRPCPTSLSDDRVQAFHLARALKMSRCAEVLHNFDSSVATELKPRESLVFVVLNLKSKKYVRAELVKRLAEAGYDINVCMGDQGKLYPPLYHAVVNKDIGLIKTLLTNGASLFKEKDISMLGCPPRLLAEYIYHNADICTEYGSVLNDILEGGKKREKLFYLVLQCAHTISQTDREKLRRLCLDENFYGYTRVMEFLHSPRRLDVLSRNAIRKHYAHNIHWFLSNAVLPPLVRDFISLESQLGLYLTLPLKFSKAYEDLDDDIFLSDFYGDFH